jgi:photosystem II stability/assembly factor-like uncharacterized protein
LTAAVWENSPNLGPIYTTTNSGITWTQTSAPSNNWVSVASSADGSKLVAASAPVIINSGWVFPIYTSTDSGMTWISNNVPNAPWDSVASSADGTKLVAAGQSTPIYTSTNSGTTWISNNTPSQIWLGVASSADGNKLVAAALSASGNPGSIYSSYTAPTPLMKLAPSGGNLAFSWIVPSTNFVLQQNFDLTTAGWVTLTNTPVLNLTNLQNEVTLSPANSSGFFRLISQ